ncbi:hypothetical protein OsJ_13916 [Oryza sativa Japonica Group]|uniref:Uncharacterized protein n=1 Tax=Oryza sativa subsp. japonica TaxID=39947 RepID=A3ARB7_ORYSJ|nr:hypothetical protein OsJ_13916 [Oryza sativa Japonica Group]
MLDRLSVFKRWRVRPRLGKTSTSSGAAVDFGGHRGWGRTRLQRQLGTTSAPGKTTAPAVAGDDLISGVGSGGGSGRGRPRCPVARRREDAHGARRRRGFVGVEEKRGGAGFAGRRGGARRQRGRREERGGGGDLGGEVVAAGRSEGAEEAVGICAA